MNLYKINMAAVAIARAIAPDDSADRRKAIAERWRRELMDGFLKGALHVLDAGDQIPIRPDRPGAVVAGVVAGAVTLAELNRWLAAQGVPIAITEKHFAEAAAHTPSNCDIDEPTVGLSWRADAYWVQVAHAQANQIAQRNVERRYGGTSQRDVMSDVATELQKDPRFPALSVDPQTIRRVLLKGWRWRHTVVVPTARPG